MTSGIDARARQAAVDLQLATWDARLPPEGSTARRWRRQRRVVQAVAALTAVVLVAGLVAVVAARRDATPAGPTNVPDGFRAVSHPADGFAIAVPKDWTDDPLPVPPDLVAYAAHSPADGSPRIQVHIQDVGPMPMADEVSFIATNAGAGAAGTVARSSASFHGVQWAQLDWRAGHRYRAYIDIIGGRNYAIYFYDEAIAVSGDVMDSFRALPLPALSAVARKTLGGPGFSLRVPTDWVTQPPPASTKPGIDRVLVSGGVEGAAFVNRQPNTADSLEQALADLRAEGDPATAAPVGAHGGRVTHTTLAGQPALRYDYLTTKRQVPFVTPPGIRQVYVVRQGTDLVYLALSGADTKRTSQLFDQIAHSFTL